MQGAESTVVPILNWSSEADVAIFNDGNERPLSFFGECVQNVSADKQCAFQVILMDNATLSTVVTSNHVIFDEDRRPPSDRHWMFLFLGVFVLAGGLGNLLVCLAICLERRLQNVTNYFLLSLAVADLLVCVAVMPFGMIKEFYGYWPFNDQLCNVWVTCDVLSCSASIMHMCFISLGRFMGIRNPIKTRHNSKKMVMLKIVLVWLVAMAITSPITVLATVDTLNIRPNPETCAINNRFFFVFGSLFAFYLPMVIMVTTYILTVRLLRRKAKFCAEKNSRRVPFVRRLKRSSFNCQEIQEATKPQNGHITKTFHQQAMHRMRIEQEQSPQQRRQLVREQSSGSSSTNFQFDVVGGMIRTLGSSQVRNEQKASKVLGLVFFTFVICWAPFFILNIMFVVRSPETFPEYLITTFLWLGYASSTINPIIYTIFNRTFKRTFWRLLTCRCHQNRHIRSRPSTETFSWAYRSSTHYSNKATSPLQRHPDSIC